MAGTPKVHHRWIRLTPDRFVLGLLAVEVFLLLSEWRCWFAFNEHKGWTVLIAVAALGAALLLLLIWLVASLLLRRRFQFGIRSLLVLVVAVAVPCSWMAVRMQQARRQKEAVAAIVEMGVAAQYDDVWENPFSPFPLPKPHPCPKWLRTLLGDDFFRDVTATRIETDAGLEQIHRLTQLHELSLSSSRITDDGLRYLDGLVQLRTLRFTYTRISDTGLQHLEGLTQLRSLDLGEAQVGDAGLRSLEGLTQLQELHLYDTQITDAGLRYLKGLAQLQVLNLTSTQVTDVGMEHLQRLPQLTVLGLWGTSVTDAGLEHLKGLTHLHELNLGGTEVTDEAVKEFQQTLPGCKVKR